MILPLLLALALDDPAAPAMPPPADCSIVGVRDASRILGYSVGPPEETSRAGGTCFFVSSDASEDGTLSYTIVTPQWLPFRRQYFRAYARRCAPAAKGTLNELACRQYLALGEAADLDAYFAARASASDASPVPGLGDSAVATENGLFVRRSDAVYEFAVVRSGDFDLERTTQLAHALLDRPSPPS